MIDISIVNFVFCKSWILNFSTGIKVATEYKYISSDCSTVVLKSTSTKSIHYINDYLINLLINFSVAPLSVDILDKEKQPIAGIFIQNFNIIITLILNVLVKYQPHFIINLLNPL